MGIESFLLLPLGFLIFLVFLLDCVQFAQIVHCLDQAEVVFESFGKHILVDGLGDLVLLLKVLDFFTGAFILIVSIAIDLNVLEEVEEGLLFNFLGLLFASLLLVFLLDYLDGDVLALLPLDRIALALLDNFPVEDELLVQLGV